MIIALKLKLKLPENYNLIVSFKHYYLAMEIFNLDLFYLTSKEIKTPIDTLNERYHFEISKEKDKFYIALRDNANYTINKNNELNYFYPFLKHYTNDQRLLDKIFINYNQLYKKLHNFYWK